MDDSKYADLNDLELEAVATRERYLDNSSFGAWEPSHLP
jgi:hypothetical protein